MSRITDWIGQDRQRLDVLIGAFILALLIPLTFGSPEEFDTGWPEVAAGVGAFVIMVFRRRWPVPLLVVALGWSVVHVIVWERPSPIFFATLVMLATVCVRIERWQAIALGVGVGVTLYGVSLWATDVAIGDGRAVVAIAWAGAAVGIADATRTWRSYKASAEAELAAVRAAAEDRTRREVTEERMAIAREVHDLLSHNLSVMNVQTGAAMHLLRADPDRAEEALQVARDSGRTVLDELRELLAVLRHDEDDDAPLASLPTVDQIDDLVENVRRTGVEVTWSESGERRPMAPVVSLAAYRVVQESLTNAAKYGTGTVSLATMWDDEELSILVVNGVRDGADGFGGPDGDAVVRGGHGIIGMRERVESNQGSFHVGGDSGRFELTARLPVLQPEGVSE